MFSRLGSKRTFFSVIKTPPLSASCRDPHLKWQTFETADLHSGDRICDISFENNQQITMLSRDPGIVAKLLGTDIINMSIK